MLTMYFFCPTKGYLHFTDFLVQKKKQGENFIKFFFLLKGGDQCP